MRRNLEILEVFAARHQDCLGMRSPRGGTTCFPRLEVEGGAEAFCEQLVEIAGLMLVPSTVFEFGDAHVRFGLGREDLEANLERLEPFLAR